MPRYFFHLRDESRFLTDEEGVELSDIIMARAEARRWGEVILDGAGITTEDETMIVEIWSETEPLELVVINRHVTRGKAPAIHQQWRQVECRGVIANVLALSRSEVSHSVQRLVAAGQATASGEFASITAEGFLAQVGCPYLHQDGRPPGVRVTSSSSCSRGRTISSADDRQTPSRD